MYPTVASVPALGALCSRALVQLPAEVKDLLKCMLCRSRKRRISAEGILAHSALGSVPISMSDLDQMERELRRQEKEKIDSEEESRLNYYNNSGPITRNLQQ